ncbi:MAG: (5-formylfuran-3-yl)methyl phosphate synthase [Planctomycetaceae bacterium]
MSPVVDTSEPQQQRDPLALSVPDGAPPRLLVSVRNADEARLAIAAGVDLLDCKEPLNGPLGRPDAATIRQIIVARDELAPWLAVSAALGELAEWQSAATVPTGDFLNDPAPNLVKVGLAGVASQPHWIDQWRRVRDRIDVGTAQPVVHVAVCYADWRAAGAPNPDAVVAAAIATECKGVLFDTWSKTGGNLLSILSVQSLAPVLRTIRSAGLFAALAGGLRLQDLSALRLMNFDILAVRGAACVSGNRIDRISAGQIVALREQLQRYGTGAAIGQQTTTVAPH